MKYLLIFGLTLLVACTSQDDRILFDGLYFRTKSAAVDRKVTLAEFDVQVRDALRAPQAALQAGEYEGVSYCIDKFGTSQIIWTRGPDAELSDLVFDNETLLMRGVCDPP